MGNDWKKLGIIAGGGQLPVKLASYCETRGRPFFVLRLLSYADEGTEPFPNATSGIAEVGKTIRLLKEQGCDAIVLAGHVRRPNFAALRPDLKGASLLPKVVRAARKGDGALLEVLIETLEGEGFQVVGAEEIMDDLLASRGAMTDQTPTAVDWSDIAKAAGIVRALGPYDVGQGAVVRNGFVLAIEAAEGTDAMLTRCANLPPDQLGYEPGQTGRCGVLFKQPKPDQELRVDLPTIGVETVDRAAACGLAGVAVMAGAALILDAPAVRERAREAGVFVIGVGAEDLGEE